MDGLLTLGFHWRYVHVVANCEVLTAGASSGRVKIELFADQLPKYVYVFASISTNIRTTENFRQFCTGEYRPSGRPVGYKGSVFHRVVKDFMIQGGDFVKGNGQGSQTIFGSQKFDDEAFPFNHDKYSVSMANSGPNTNGCQFFICTARTPHLDGKHVVFGKVVEGFDVVDAVNAVKTAGDRPSADVRITECGEM